MTRYLLLLALLFGHAAHAHQGGNAYLTLQATASEQLQGKLEIPLVDLDRVMVFDSNNDQAITWGELKSRHNDIRQSILGGLQLRTDQACELDLATPQVDKREDLAYSVWAFTTNCAWSATIAVDYKLFRGLDAGHRLHVIVRKGETNIHRIINPADGPLSINTSTASWWDNFVEFTWQGIWHIWIGLDHILFLFALLVVAVYKKGEPVTEGRAAVYNTVKLVTAFTIAHSITLILASLDLVSLPSQFVETCIALSIIIVAMVTLKTMSSEHRWGFAFVLGLLHGFGFAGVLGDLALPQADFVIALLAFNIGVEIGQLALVAIFMPFAIALRHTLFYRYVVVIGGSIAISIVAAMWAWERYMGVAG